MTQDHGSYDVGYMKPPKQSQFKKGCSGNPRGRPKGRQNLKTIAQRVMEETVTIIENGQRRTVTKKVAAITQIVNSAVKGDRQSAPVFLKLVEIVDAEDSSVSQSSPESDLAVIAGAIARLERRSPDDGGSGSGNSK
jgi:Family of unknown function (DUF5681)